MFTPIFLNILYIIINEHSNTVLCKEVIFTNKIQVFPCSQSRLFSISDEVINHILLLIRRITRQVLP